MADNLEQLLQGVDIVDFLRNQGAGPNVYPGVPAEYTNWRDEQWAWQNAAVLFNQSYHMVDLRVTGPDAFAMLNYLGINSFKGFTPNKAKQWVPVTPEGYVIGDVILFYLGENEFNLVGRAPAIEWTEFHAASGKWNVQVERDERWALRNDGKRRSYRFQVQGPNAFKVMNKAVGSEVPQLKFFNMTTLKIAGKDVGALRHGMAGQPGYELYGPWEDYQAVHSALVEAGKEFGLRLVGGRAYSSNTLESGWIPSPMPGFFTGEGSKAFREWSGVNSYGGKASAGGSYIPDSVEGYYLTPWDLGYGFFVKFDHDFIGREALERMDKEPKRVKVTLALDTEDFIRAQSSMFTKGGDRAKYFEFPSAVYSMHNYDQVLVDGKQVGVSTWIGYSSNEGRMLTLAILDQEHATPGTKVTLLWGEPTPTKKPTVEPHVQTEIKATVAPVPYAESARDAYAEGWRTKQGA